MVLQRLRNNNNNNNNKKKKKKKKKKNNIVNTFARAAYEKAVIVMIAPNPQLFHYFLREYHL